MATAISVANFQAALGEVYDAVESLDWAAAWRWYVKAEAQHSGLEASASAGEASLSRRNALDGLRVALETAQAARDRKSATSRFLATRVNFGLER
jgi:hypothetical protein